MFELIASIVVPFSAEGFLWVSCSFPGSLQYGDQDGFLIKLLTNVVLRTSLDARTLDAVNRLLNKNTGKVGIRAETFPITSTKRGST